MSARPHLRLEIAPSLASADQMNLGSAARELEAAGAPVLHLDIEDGNFIPNITFGLKTIRQLRQVSGLPFCVHLMVTNPLAYVEELVELGAARIAFHFEAAPYPLEVVRAVRDRGVQVGVAFNPRTSLAPARYLLPDVDYLLLLTAEPDGRGQEFIAGMLDKVREALALAGSVTLSATEVTPSPRASTALSAETSIATDATPVPADRPPAPPRPWVMVDGGIGRKEMKELYGLGVRHFVLGRLLFGSQESMAGRLTSLQQEAEQWS